MHIYLAVANTRKFGIPRKEKKEKNCTGTPLRCQEEVVEGVDVKVGRRRGEGGGKAREEGGGGGGRCAFIWLLGALVFYLVFFHLLASCIFTFDTHTHTHTHTLTHSHTHTHTHTHTLK